MTRAGSVQVAPPGGGKNIRNRELEEIQPDGTILTLEQQVVTMAHSDGSFLDVDEQRMRLVHDTAALAMEAFRAGSYPMVARAFSRDAVGQR